MIYSQNKSKRQKQEILDRIVDLEEDVKKHIIFQKQTLDDIMSKFEELTVRIEVRKEVLTPFVLPNSET
jgi:hypothetical protein